jgi:hypothetical protein
MSEKPKGCESCRYCARQDTGYSEYTITGQDVWCLLKLNPDMPTNSDVITREDIRRFEAALAFGETCEKHTDGAGVWLDINGDGVEDYKDDPELYELLKSEQT